jgi:Tol biopolymer transport system component
VRVSPDGRRIAYAARDSEGKVSLRVHSLESNSARSLPGTEGVTGSFFWSPDSRFLGFLVSNKLRKVEAAGSPPQTICDLPGPWRAGAWSPAGVIVFSISDKGLMRVSDGGGVPSLLLAEGHTTSPSFLSDGRHFLYQRSVDSPENNGIYLGSLDAKPVEFTSRRILATQSSPLYAPSSDSAMGYLLFTREGTLMAQLFDSRRMELAGEAVPIAERFSNTGAFAASASATGVLAYRANPSPNSKLAWYDRSGKMLAASEPGPYNTLTLSPDGMRVAVAQYTEQEGNIWIHDSSLGPGTRFTFEKRADWMPVWSPDGSRIVWSAAGDAYNLHQKASSGAGKEEVVLKSAERKFTNDWSRDGRFLLYSSIGRGSDLWYLPMTGDDRKPRIYLQTEFNEYQARFSPDTRFVAYTSDETGRPEVYVRPFPDAASGKWMVSKSGGNQPQWRGDGKELFYISGDSKMMSVEVSASPAFQSLAPKELFLAPIFAPPNTNTTRYSVTADGKRFVIVCTDGSQAPTSITVILNWQAGLRK